MNYNPCITIDVSQGKSHIQGFIGYNNKNRKPDNITQPKVMRHSKQGFNKIIELISIIKSKTNLVPIVIFEFTGVYHKTLEKFLQKIILNIILLHHYVLLNLAKMILEA